jgi:hypothetical protein
MESQAVYGTTSTEKLVTDIQNANKEVEIAARDVNSIIKLNGYWTALRECKALLEAAKKLQSALEIYHISEKKQKPQKK